MATFTANVTEWQAREIARALEDRADKYPVDDLECRLNLSLLQLAFLTHAEECLDRDRQAIRQEYGL